jgi:hypothetical protein
MLHPMTRRDVKSILMSLVLLLMVPGYAYAILPLRDAHHPAFWPVAFGGALLLAAMFWYVVVRLQPRPVVGMIAFGAATLIMQSLPSLL